MWTWNARQPAAHDSQCAQCKWHKKKNNPSVAKPAVVAPASSAVKCWETGSGPSHQNNSSHGSAAPC
ncbi:hypothetical protein COCVIDRAFT_102723 [Bipolaris victoriae FI3]|uniref:Uncharacterized protein n=1 Tax=Bipolaris victoriae (strain FI3) TaxID=930091 RepID=W7EC19_BIPV3|nr:hypothetical protein COCVIDRAFT_102723 [Bipolaris victoriae FI3]